MSNRKSKLSEMQKRRALVTGFRTRIATLTLLTPFLNANPLLQAQQPFSENETRVLGQGSIHSAGELPASPWSKRGQSVEQASTEVPVTKREAKRPEPNETPRPAMLRWGAIREADTADSPQRSNSSSRPEAAGRTTKNTKLTSESPSRPKSSQPTSRSSQLTTLDAEDEFAPLSHIEDNVEETSQVVFDDERVGSISTNTRSAPNQKPSRTIPARSASSSKNQKTEEESFLLVPGQDVERINSAPSGSAMVAAPTSKAREPENTLQEAERLRVAQMQSLELQSMPMTPKYGAPQILENPVGWKAIREELRKHLDQCDQLLKRGATHSARAQVVTGLRKLFRTMDLYRGRPNSESAFELALAAMREEADFHSLAGVRTVASVVATHSTTALKGRPLEQVSAELASQHYRQYARYQLLQAADGHLYAADLFYALGKTLEREAELDSEVSHRMRSQAVLCYQAALQIRPDQHHANNQLGFALIHLDRIDEAYDALKTSLQTQPNAAAWTNLAEIYRRRGAGVEADYAVKQAMSLASDPAAAPPSGLEITEVDPTVFARFSPAQNAGGPAATSPQVASMPAPAPSKPSSSGNFFSKIFR